MRNLKSLTIVLITSLTISGCVGYVPTPEPIVKKIYVTTPLQLPTKPEWPRVAGSDVMCLSVEAKQKILARDMAIKGYIEDLETTILSTQKSK